MITAFVSGTGTDVGKTFVAAAALRALRDRGARVAARKPVQSFDPGAAATDAEVLAAATGEPPEVVAPRHRWYELALAPPMAADRLGRGRLLVGDLVAELAPAPPGTDMILVEGAGGPRSPIAHDGDNVDLAAAIAPAAVVLVAEAGLGVLNAVRLAAAPLTDVAPVTVALNRFEPRNPLHADNRRWLVERFGFAVVTSARALAGALLPAGQRSPAS